MAEKKRPGTTTGKNSTNQENTLNLGGASERTRSEQRAKESAKRDGERYGSGLDPDSGDGGEWPRAT